MKCIICDIESNLKLCSKSCNIKFSIREKVRLNLDNSRSFNFKCVLCNNGHHGLFGKGDFCSAKCSLSSARKLIDPIKVQQSHDDRKLKRKQHLETLPKKLILPCETCNKEHDGKYASGRFCCVTCSRISSTKNNREEISKRVSLTLKERFKNIPKKVKLCKLCNGPTKRIQLIYCSKECKNNCEIYKEIKSKSSSIAAKKRVDSGRHKGWMKRHKDTPSYPEQYFIKLFDNEQIKINREVKVGKYFVDFIPDNCSLAIEIDGSQHDFRVEKDQEKDKFLVECGYEVFRIRWYNPVTERNKELLYSQIEQMKMKILNMTKDLPLLEF